MGDWDQVVRGGQGGLCCGGSQRQAGGEATLLMRIRYHTPRRLGAIFKIQSWQLLVLTKAFAQINFFCVR